LLQRLDVLQVDAVRLEHVVPGVGALVVLRGRRLAEAEDDAVVPARRVPAPRFGRIVEHRDAVDRTVDRARLDAHDEGHGLALERGRGGKVDRPRAQRIGQHFRTPAA
jgi:hypothetical protein